jgi:beta-glucosidase-like glycosyl hydrolase
VSAVPTRGKLGRYSNHLIDAYADKKVSLATIKRALFNTFQIRFRLGLFDPKASSPWSKLNQHDDVDTAEAQQLNKEASRQSLVLLQNKKRTLPFVIPKREGRVVIIGASVSGRSSRSYFYFLGVCSVGGSPFAPRSRCTRQQSCAD